MKAGEAEGVACQLKPGGLESSEGMGAVGEFLPTDISGVQELDPKELRGSLGSKGCSPGKDALSREAVGFLLGTARLHSSWKCWGGCPGTKTREDCAEEPGPGERCWGDMLHVLSGL